ncbi:MAG: hypothetical protein K2J99_02815 [Lachnospiraceae bacterium]|nr:hypothetical protein [Lachnospiraceae bacterium]
MSRHRLRLACGGLDILRASCYWSANGGTKFPHCIRNANGGILKKSKSGIDRTGKIAYY